MAGITFLDKTRVGWWKNGFPIIYTRIPKAVDWRLVNLHLIDEELDLAGWDVDSFNRRLDMKEGIFYRDMEVTSTRRKPAPHPCRAYHKYGKTQPLSHQVQHVFINYTGRISLMPILNRNTVDDADLPEPENMEHTAFQFYQQLPISGHRPAGKMHKCTTP